MMSECAAPVSINERTIFRARLGVNDKCIVFRRWEKGVLVGYDVIEKKYGDKWLGIKEYKRLNILFVYPLSREVNMLRKIFQINK